MGELGFIVRLPHIDDGGWFRRLGLPILAFPFSSISFSFFLETPPFLFPWLPVNVPL
jgi:hypothetical protein